ncbi:MAG: type II secretion system secretin GspD [Halioglobus sp.]
MTGTRTQMDFFKRSQTLFLTAILSVLLGSCAGMEQVVEEPPEVLKPQPAVADPETGGTYYASEDETGGDAVASVGPREQIHRGTGSFIRQVAEPVTNAADGEITLNFQGAPIAEVAKAILGDILGVNYIIAEGVTGSVSMRTASPISEDDLIPALDSLLQLSGAALIQSGEFYEIVPIDEGVIASLSPQLRLSANKGYQMIIVPLSYIGAREMVRILEPVKSGKAVVQADEFRNLIILAGTQSELFSLRKTISIFDVDQLTGMSVGLFRLENVDSNTILVELDRVFGDTAEGPLAGMVKFTVIERLNALMVITPQQEYLKHAELWIERLDQNENPHGFNMYVYYVQNGKSERLAELLNGMFEEKRRTSTVSRQLTAARQAPESSGEERDGNLRVNAEISTIEAGEVSIVAYAETNALLITANPADYKAVEKAIQQLDVLPMQVLIEASIVEVTLSDNLEYGLQWFFKGSPGDFNSVGGLNIPASGNVGAEGALVGALADPVNFTYALFDANGTRAVLNAMAAESRLNVLSAPSLMVLDNHTAVIRVGDQVPIRTQETTNTASSISDPDGNIGNNVTSQIQYRDTGVTLEVTPRVNAGGMVMLEITQRVDDVNETTTSSIDSPTILQREITTTVAVQSGATIVLGGLIEEGVREEESGIPILMDIPVLGALFKSKRITEAKTELVVLITPSAVANPEQARTVTEEYKSKLKDVDFSSFK